MTYEELGKFIEELSDEEKQCDVSVYLNRTDEFMPVDVCRISTPDIDVLDPGSPYLIIEF